MTKQEKAALERAEVDLRRDSDRAVVRIFTEDLRTLLRLAKRADASAVTRAERAVVRETSRFLGRPSNENWNRVVGAQMRLERERAKAKKARRK